eukprot:1158274-Pelagomonas_calceolata.AAC.70
MHGHLHNAATFTQCTATYTMHGHLHKAATFAKHVKQHPPALSTHLLKAPTCTMHGQQSLYLRNVPTCAMRAKQHTYLRKAFCQPRLGGEGSGLNQAPQQANKRGGMQGRTSLPRPHHIISSLPSSTVVVFIPLPGLAAECCAASSRSFARLAAHQLQHAALSRPRSLVRLAAHHLQHAALSCPRSLAPLAGHHLQHAALSCPRSLAPLAAHCPRHAAVTHPRSRAPLAAYYLRPALRQGRQAFGRMGRGYMLAKPYTRHTKPCMVQGGGGPNGGMDATCIPLNNNASMGQEQRHTHTLLGMHS